MNQLNSGEWSELLELALKSYLHIQRGEQIEEELGEEGLESIDIDSVSNGGVFVCECKIFVIETNAAVGNVAA